MERMALEDETETDCLSSISTKPRPTRTVGGDSAAGRYIIHITCM